MPPTVSGTKPKRAKAVARTVVTTPLGLYVLALLVIESTMAIVLTTSQLSEEHVWAGFLGMIWVFGGVILIVTALVFFRPKNLLFGKEEHAHPALELSALRDQLRDLTARVDDLNRTRK
jgi:hypothetical protein